MANRYRIGASIKNRLTGYTHVVKTSNDIEHVLAIFGGSLVLQDGRDHCDSSGQIEKLVSLTGFVPVFISEDDKRHVPIEIWIRRSHPYLSPEVKVTPMEGMGIRVSQFVDASGHVTLPYLDKWKEDPSTATYNLADLIQDLCATFSDYYPLQNNSPPPTPVVSLSHDQHTGLQPATTETTPNNLDSEEDTDYLPNNLNTEEDTDNLCDLQKQNSVEQTVTNEQVQKCNITDEQNAPKESETDCSPPSPLPSPPRAQNDHPPHESHPLPNAESRSTPDGATQRSTVNTEWFVDRIPDIYRCKICYHVFQGPIREPLFMSCCGNHVCKLCFETFRKTRQEFRQPVVCVYCKSDEVKTFPVADITEAVQSLRVRCSQKRDGCKWIGTVQEAERHLQTCQKVLISCSNGCSEQFQRCQLDEHNSVCQFRQVPCPFKDIGCQDVMKSDLELHRTNGVHQHLLQVVRANSKLSEHCQATVQSLKASHQEKKTRVGEERRKFAAMMKDFERVNSLISTYESRLSEMRKRIRILRKDGHQHVKKVKTEVQSTGEKLRDLNCFHQACEERISSMPTPEIETCRLIPTTFKMDQFTSRKQNNEQWFSPPFYTHLGGYKMCLSVLPNDYDIQSGSNFVSIFIHLMAGEFDSHLQWPFSGAIITVTALNKRRTLTGSLFGCMGNISRQVHLDGESSRVARLCVLEGYQLRKECLEFLSYKFLDQFLAQDCLELKISNINFLPT